MSEMPEQNEPFLRSILAVTDGSSVGEHAVQYARALARSQGGFCQLHVAYVVDTASLDLMIKLHFFVQTEREAYQLELENRGRKLLAQLKEECLQEGMAVSTYLMRGRVSQAVLQAAKQLNAETIVIGGWKNTTTQKDTASMERQLILNQAECPVIVVK